MTYAMSDIHGCYDKYMQMLEKIKFCDNDTLYVLGDIIDRGTQPVKILQDMSMRANVIPVMGNHEFYAHEILTRLFIELKDGDFSHLFPAEREHLAWEISEWTDMTKIGGYSTLEDFRALPQDERIFLLEYIEDFSLYEVLQIKKQRYILTHSGLPDNATLSTLHLFDAYDFSIAATDYNEPFPGDVILVTGHIPTFVLDDEYRGKIYRKHNHIAIDCGAESHEEGGRLGCICLETGEEFYV
jgi:serine/threonine protein phosphatase 1